MPSDAERPSVLDNPHSERVRRVAGLAGRSARSRAGLMLVEGPQAVGELVVHRPQWVRDVYLEAAAFGRHPGLADAARRATRWVHEVSPEVSHAMSGDAQGVIAVADAAAVGGCVPGPDGFPLGTPPTRAGQPPAGPADDRGLPGVVVVLARAQDPGNAGTIIRAADAMGAVGVVLTRDCVDVRSPKVVRASAGSVFHLPVVTDADLGPAVGALHARDCVVAGTSGGDGSLDLSELLRDAATGVPSLLTGPLAWVFGNEAQGLSPAEEDACDVLVRIPMTGDAESLNVATAAAVCLFASQHARTATGA